MPTLQQIQAAKAAAVRSGSMSWEEAFGSAAESQLAAQQAQIGQPSAPSTAPPPPPPAPAPQPAQTRAATPQQTVAPQQQTTVPQAATPQQAAQAQAAAAALQGQLTHNQLGTPSQGPLSQPNAGQTIGQGQTPGTGTLPSYRAESGLYDPSTQYWYVQNENGQYVPVEYNGPTNSWVATGMPSNAPSKPSTGNAAGSFSNPTAPGVANLTSGGTYADYQAQQAGGGATGGGATGGGVGTTTGGGAAPGYTTTASNVPQAASTGGPTVGGATPGSTASNAATGLQLSDLYKPFDLPYTQAQMQTLRDMQSKSLEGLKSLMDEDPYATTAKLQSSIYDPAAQAIQQAAQDQYHQMIEGTFGRGTGQSSISVELGSRLAQASESALAKASQDAYVQARQQANQDLASRQNLLQGGFSAGTTGLQAEANVGLANAQNLMSAAEFLKNMQFQGGENAANRDLSWQEFQQNLGLQLKQLEQQNSQFNTGLNFTAMQNDANRALQLAMQTSNFQFTKDENALQRDFTKNMTQLGYDFTANQSDLNRAYQTSFLKQQQDYAASQTKQQQDWQAAQNEAQRQLQVLLQQQIAAAQGDRQAQAALTGGIGAFIGGLAGLFGAPKTTTA